MIVFSLFLLLNIIYIKKSIFNKFVRLEVYINLSYKKKLYVPMVHSFMSEACLNSHQGFRAKHLVVLKVSEIFILFSQKYLPI